MSKLPTTPNKPSAPAKTPAPPSGVRRIPTESVLYERLIPIALIAMGVLLVVILALALAFMLGLIRY